MKFPARVHEHVPPPSAERVEAVFWLLTPGYRLPLLVLDASGVRVGELEALTWGDLRHRRISLEHLRGQP